MKIKMIVLCIALIACSAVAARAQDTTTAQETATAQNPTEQPVALAEKAVALEASGRAALSATLLTNSLQGTPEAPVKNVRFVVENRDAVFYTYVSGTITFYKEGNVRCGEGLFALNSLAPGEAAETDAPGLRLECAPSAWRIVATNLLTRANEAVRPVETQPPAQPAAAAAPSPLYLTIEGKQYEVPLNSTLEIPVRTRRIKITLSDQP
ncbi:MAG TPA: hypothetical protein VEQ40_05965 [Pyrinomonadaceae bacterium]|nr:hypothetical protein [Pyrinomonadaceae bacterium]